MAVTIGIYEAGAFVSPIITEVFGPCDDVVHLQSLPDVEAFISDKQFPNVKILVTSVLSLAESSGIWLTLKTLVEKVETFHLVLLKEDGTALPSSLPIDVGGEKVHLVEYGQPQEDETTHELLHHLRGIKRMAELLDQKYRVFDLWVYLEELTEECSQKPRFDEFIKKLRRIINAQSLSIYFLHSLASNFVCVYETSEDGSLPVSRVVGASVYEKFEFKNTCSTYFLSQNQRASLSSLEPGAENSTGIFILSTFLLDTIPCFILYTFDESEYERFMSELCYVSSWVVFHLIHEHENLSRYKTMKRLTEIEAINLEKRDLINYIIDCLQEYFDADGVSIIEYKGVVNGKHNFEKTFKHYKNPGHVSFSTSEGFAYHCVVNKKALLVTETIFEKTSPDIHDPADPHDVGRKDNGGTKVVERGEGIELEPDALQIDIGKPITLRLFRADKTVEDEVSLMYYPLVSGGDVIGSIKIGDFTKPNAFGLLQLRALSIFADPVMMLLKNVQVLGKLKVSHEQIPEALENMAGLLTYRNLIRDIFHQVNQYLSDIGAALLTAQSFAGDKPATELTTSLNNIKQYAKFAMELIGRARSRGEKLQPVPQDCDLVDAVVRPSIDYAKKKADLYKINIKPTLTSQDYPVRLDPDFAQESLKNILNNAIWAIREHKTAGKREIHIAVRETHDKESVYIEVTDSGIGIDPSIRSKVGELFFTTRKGGSGVGVYSARRHVEHFNGSVKLGSSMPGKGTTVILTFPLRG
jgi:signal transduction histidine kinase